MKPAGRLKLRRVSIFDLARLFGMKYYHHIYGLTLCSDISFPELREEQDKPSDVTLRFGKFEIDKDQPIESDKDLGFWIMPDMVAVISQKMGQFLVRNGNEIIINPFLHTDEQAIRSLVLDILLPAALHQRGFLLLHASAVACDGAIAFVGPSGAGKSTMAIAMHTYRQQLVTNADEQGGIFTDDLVAIEFDDMGNPWVLPGFFQLKFLPETVQGINQLENAISSELDPLTKKHICSNSTYFAKDKMRLEQIYVLSESENICIESLSPQECFLTLINNSYATGFLKATKSSADQFHKYMKLAQKTSVYRLNRPKSFSALPELVKLVEQKSSLLTKQ